MKKQNSELQVSRRQFVRQSACAALGYTGIVNSLTQLTMVNSAVAQTLPGYKALVVLFLAGGNDSANMIIPRIGHPEYDRYKSGRGALTIFDSSDPGRGGAPASIPLTTPDGSYGVHPNMAGVASLFNSGEAAFVLNTGTLAFPILTREQYINGTVPVPPQLYSHSDQQVQWQSSLPDQPFQTGWGGRVADLLTQSPSTSVAMNISIAGINSLQVGGQTAQFALAPDGTLNLNGYGTNYGSALNADKSYKTTVQGRRLKAFEDIMRYTHSNLLEEGYNQTIKRGRANEDLVGAAMAAAAASGVNYNTVFGTSTTGLSSQLKMIAKLIAGRSSLGNSRQIFFASISGYDTHSGQTVAHNNLMTELSTSLKAFSDAMIALGVNDNVLTITHSDFGRTLTPNGSDSSSAGSDHAWGGHQLVMGGAVNGGRIYGYYPSLVLSGGLDTLGRGQFIPTTSVDQYAAVAAKWFGVGSTELSTIFPNLGRFTDPFSAAAKLGYV